MNPKTGLIDDVFSVCYIYIEGNLNILEIFYAVFQGKNILFLTLSAGIFIIYSGCSELKTPANPESNKYESALFFGF